MAITTIQVWDVRLSCGTSVFLESANTNGSAGHLCLAAGGLQEAALSSVSIQTDPCYSPWHKDLVRSWLQVSRSVFQKSKTWLKLHPCSAKSFLTNKGKKMYASERKWGGEGRREHSAKVTEVPSNSVSKLRPNADALLTGNNSGMSQIAQNYLRETGLAAER